MFWSVVVVQPWADTSSVDFRAVPRRPTEVVGGMGNERAEGERGRRRDYDEPGPGLGGGLVEEALLGRR